MHPAVLAEKIGATDETTADPEFALNYNVAPAVRIAAVVGGRGEAGDEPTRRVRSMRWPWAASESGAGRLLTNARAEKATPSPAFRSSARSRRCPIPMDGFYEWRASAGKTNRRTPFGIHRRDGGLLFAAGLLATRPGPSSSCALIITAAVGELAEYP